MTALVTSEPFWEGDRSSWEMLQPALKAQGDIDSDGIVQETPD